MRSTSARTVLVLSFVLLAQAAPARAAGVGVSLPKFRMLGVSDSSGTASSVGGSVQVFGTNLSAGAVQLDLGLDYAYTRDFARSTNYSFFDLGVGAGLPLRVGPQFYLTPALDTHTLFWVASPQPLDGTGFGLAPRLTVGFKPASAIKVELSTSYTFLIGQRSAGRAVSGGMAIVELGGSYSF